MERVYDEYDVAKSQLLPSQIITYYITLHIYILGPLG